MSGTWILDSSLSVIPDSLRYVLGSKDQDSGFHIKAEFSWISDPTRRNFLDYRIQIPLPGVIGCKSIIFVQVKLSAISRNPLYKSDFNSS